MKIAVLGGSFNPIHIGHLILADCVTKELGYDKVLFIPVYNPPHKEMANAASPEDRLQMVKEAVKGDSRFEAEGYEIEKKGVSYTWDTICYLEKKYEGKLTDKIGLIFGFDLAADFDKWKNAEQLSKKCQLIMAVRPDDYRKNSSAGNLNKATGAFNHQEVDFKLEDFKFPFIKVFNPEMALSSSDIRDRIHSCKSWRYIVSEGVFDYIKNRKLYGYTDGRLK